jgi:hypothetical protein
VNIGFVKMDQSQTGQARPQPIRTRSLNQPVSKRGLVRKYCVVTEFLRRVIRESNATRKYPLVAGVLGLVICQLEFRRVIKARNFSVGVIALSHEFLLVECLRCFGDQACEKEYFHNSSIVSQLREYRRRRSIASPLLDDTPALLEWQRCAK